VSIAINSARLLEQTQQLLEAERRAYGKITSDVWADQARTLTNLGFIRNPSGFRPIGDIHEDKTRELLREGRAIVDSEDQLMLYVPVRIRKQIIGILKLRHSSEAGRWKDEDIELMETLAEQIGVALESARSYQETQGRAERESLLADITSKVRASTDVNVILQTAVQELAHALRVESGVIRLRSLDGEDPSNGLKIISTDLSPDGGNSSD
jgi:GAF domain-containing protein